jgi:hypothetical protein
MRINLKYTQFVFIAICLFCLSCQPPINDLMPIIQDGAFIVSTKKKKDIALQYDNEMFSLKVYGNWRITYEKTKLFVVIKNRIKSKIQIDFNKVLLGNSFNGSPQIHSVEVVTETLGSIYKSIIIENKIAEIGTYELQILMIDIYDSKYEFKNNERTYGNRVWFSIPVGVENNKIFNTTNCNFAFKYDYEQPEGEYIDSLID